MPDAIQLPPRILSGLRVFTATFSGLAFETLPFLLIGTFFASVISVFVPESLINRLLPRNRALSILAAMGVGFVLPICECAIVPLARRLRDKGVPTSSVLAFLLAAPIVNPMTLASTVVAFRGIAPVFFVYRLGVGLLTALCVSLAVEWMTGARHGPATDPDLGDGSREPGHGHGDGACERCHAGEGRGAGSRILELMHHCADEFLDTSRYLIAGIAVAALARASIDMSAPSGGDMGALRSLIMGEGSAYLLSLCSSADAFVARSLFAPRSYLAALAFLVVGPMIDIKNTILLSRFVKPRELAVLVALIVAVASLACLAASAAWGFRP